MPTARPAPWSLALHPSAPARSPGVLALLALAASLLVPLLGCASVPAQPGAASPSPTKRAAALQESIRPGRARLVVLPLHGTQPSSATALAAALRVGLAEMGRDNAQAVAGAGPEVEVVTVQEAVASGEAAQRVGQALGADCMLWGELVMPAEGAGRAVARMHLGAVRGAAPGRGSGGAIDDPPLAVEEKEAGPALRPVSMPIGPGPFAPGKEPVECYVGKAVHAAIAAFYDTAHFGQKVSLNILPIPSILQRWRLPVPPGLPSEVLKATPDIVNLTRGHLYEIRPATDLAGALSKVLFYQSCFRQAGIALDLGPPGEPGTQGAVPAPGGYALFSVARPGVILYQCFRGSYRQTAEAPAIEVVPRPKRAWNRRELIDEISRITGLTGVGLAIYIVLSEGSRIVFPPRNLLPAP